MTNTINSDDYNQREVRCAQLLALVFSYRPKHNSYWIGGWVEINARELQELISRKFHPSSDVTHQELRAYLIGLLIEKINNNAYGASAVYELYEERKQEALLHLFDNLVLCEDEIALIKNRCDYTEDRRSFKDLCDCGAEVNALQFAQSVSLYGKTCCVNCSVF